MTLWDALRAEWDATRRVLVTFWRSIHFRRDVLLLDPPQPRPARCAVGEALPRRRAHRRDAELLRPILAAVPGVAHLHSTTQISKPRSLDFSTCFIKSVLCMACG